MEKEMLHIFCNHKAEQFLLYPYVPLTFIEYSFSFLFACLVFSSTEICCCWLTYQPPLHTVSPAVPLSKAKKQNKKIGLLLHTRTRNYTQPVFLSKPVCQLSSLSL